MGKGTSTFPAKAIIGALVTTLIMKIFLFDFVIAEGHSMEPVIMPGNVLLVSKLSYGFKLPGSAKYLLRWVVPKKGDIIVFYTPMGEIAVKRCSDVYNNDSFYVLGENVLNSYDSRSYGPISMDSIVGKVLGKR